MGAYVLGVWVIEWTTVGTDLYPEEVIIGYGGILFPMLTLIGTRFSPHVKNQGVKNTPEENLQYLGSLMSDFDDISTVSSQINPTYNAVEIFEISRQGGLINRGQVKVTLGKNDLAGFANSVITKIWIYNSFYVFEGEESIFDIITKPPCLGDLENPGQLPVQEVLEGTDDCVL